MATTSDSDGYSEGDGDVDVDVDSGSIEDEIAALAARVADRFTATGATLACAESCTGGLIAHTLVKNPGASAWFQLGVVSYSNDAKREVLGVPSSVLDSVGAVSGECAATMADGVRRLIGADYAVASTGIAGPSGGTPTKPVGLVYLGLATADGVDTKRFTFDADRLGNIRLTVFHALSWLARATGA